MTIRDRRGRENGIRHFLFSGMLGSIDIVVANEIGVTLPIEPHPSLVEGVKVRLTYKGKKDSMYATRYATITALLSNGKGYACTIE